MTIHSGALLKEEFSGSADPLMQDIISHKEFHYASLKAWNDMPARIRELPILNRFKHQIKTHLRGKAQIKPQLPGTTVD